MNVSSVVNDDLCLSCGYCEPACPNNAIKIKFDSKRGYHIPEINEMKCDDSGLCYKVCPGVEVDFKELNSNRKCEIPEYHHLGNVLSTKILFANDLEIRKKAASGGFITALINYLFDSNQIDGAIVTRNSYDQPFNPEGYIARNKKELLDSQMSIYHTVPMGKVMDELQASSGKYIFVGIACQTHGLLKYMEVFPEIKEKIFLILGTFCGGYQTSLAHEYYFPKQGIDVKQMKSIDYRYGEFPGQFKLSFTDGEEVEINRRFNTKKLSNRYSVAFNSSFYVPRCYTCADKGNILSDITAGDPWLPKFKNEKLGKSLIVSRTKLGERLINDAINSGYITKEEASFKDVMDVQKFDKERHGNQLAYKKVFTLFNKPYPKYTFIGKVQVYNVFVYFRVMADLLRLKLRKKKSLWFFLRPIYFVESQIKNYFINNKPLDYLAKRLKGLKENE